MKNHKKQKGFTLVELLAVIVILGILILIAMPNILRVMQNARKNAWDAEVKSYIKAAQTAFAETIIDNPQVKDIYFVSSATSTNCTQNLCERKLDIDGGNALGYAIDVYDYGTDNYVHYKFEIWSSSYKTHSCNTTDSCNSSFLSDNSNFLKNFDSDVFDDDVTSVINPLKDNKTVTK